MIFELLTQVKQVLDKHLDDPAAWENQTEKVQAPVVYIGGLPNKPENIYPYVLLELPQGMDNQEISGIELEIVCGAYASDFVEGTRAIANLVDQCRIALLSATSQGKRWRLERPVNWYLGDNTELAQPRPYHLGKLVTHWQTGPIKEVA